MCFDPPPAKTERATANETQVTGGAGRPSSIFKFKCVSGNQHKRYALRGRVRSCRLLALCEWPQTTTRVNDSGRPPGFAKRTGRLQSRLGFSSQRPRVPRLSGSKPLVRPAPQRESDNVSPALCANHRLPPSLHHCLQASPRQRKALTRGSSQNPRAVSRRPVTGRWPAQAAGRRTS
jgi:hypothetical protein